MFDNDVDLSAEAKRSTLATAASWAAWLFLLGLAVLTAIHAISITMAYTNYTGGAFAAVRVFGVILAEFFAVVTAVLLATHVLRAKQKPVAIAVEVSWFIFAAMNLISSFAIEHGGEIPGFVSVWVAYGLPVAALVIGALFYVTLRLDPEAGRADDRAELKEKFAETNHKAAVEVLNSEQMRVVLRQMQWMRQPVIVGKQLGLTDAQIQALQRQAPALLDLNNDGVGDIMEQPTLPATAAAGGQNTMARLRAALGLSHSTHDAPRQTAAADPVPAPTGHGERTPVYANLSHLTAEQLRKMAADLDAGRPAQLNPNGQEAPPVRPQ